ncbi:MAG: insulinase family protein [Acidobacteria bacterium]|nr:insulinase family protein [Acidobacteriota bacterium]
MRARPLAPALLLVSLLATGASGQTPAPPSLPPLDLQEVIPLDTAVHASTLPNGVQVLVRQNARPEKRVSLRLAVKAGSMMEADDQRGLAHLIEHMAFNGSAHFAPGELVSTFEQIGMRLGPHVNAYTSFDETVYMLDLPSDQPDIVAKGLTALADYAGGLTLDPREIDKERGVVTEEWRLGLGAGSRVRDKQLPVLFYDSRYAERLPIGRPEIIRNAPAQRLRDFYDTWYRPERMAVVAVGDIDVAQMQRQIAASFSALADRAPAAPLPDRTVPLQKQLLTSIVTDPEVTQSAVEIVRKRPAESEQRVADYRRSIVQQLFERMLDDRFTEIARRPDARILGAGASDDQLGLDVSAFTMGASVPEGRIADGLTVLEIETNRVRQYGFTEPELDRAKKEYRAFFDRAYAERDKSESAQFAAEAIRHFLVDEPMPGIAYEYRLVRQVLPGITLAETTALATKILADDSRVVAVVEPAKSDLHVPTESELLAALATAAKVPLVPWAADAAPLTLLEDPPDPAPIVGRSEIPAIGVTVVRFANGVEAWLKPTDFKNDQVLFSMESLGGASVAPPADFPEASLSAGYVAASGVGPLRALDVQRALAGKLVSATPFMGLSTHGLSGSATPGELETALQILYQRFVSPSDDPDTFALMRRQLNAAAQNRGQSPGRLFRERLEEINSSDHYTSRPLTEERVDRLDRDKMLAFYRQRFSNAADFRFQMVGAFSVETVLPLLARYVGSLPSTGSATAAFRDVGMHFPARIARETVVKGREPRGQTAISFFADPDRDPVELEKLAAAALVLQTSLRDILREELGQTYSVSVGRSQDWPQRGDGYMQVSYGSAPENSAPMLDRVLQEVKRLQTDGPSEDLTGRAKESARRDYETAIAQNPYWLRRIADIRLFGGEPGDILDRGSRIDLVTPAALREMYRKYFPLDRYTVVTLTPEPQAP